MANYAVGINAPVSLGMPTENSGLMVASDFRSSQEGIRQFDPLLRPRGNKGPFQRGVACFTRSDWKPSMGRILEPLADVLRKAAANGVDPEQAEIEYLRELIDACEVVYAKTNMRNGTQISIVEQGDIQVTSSARLQPGAAVRFRLPPMKERAAMMQHGSPHDGHLAYFGAPVLESVEETSPAAAVQATIGSFLSSPKKLAQFDNYRATNGIGASPGLKMGFQMLLTFMSQLAPFLTMMGVTVVPRGSVARTKVNSLTDARIQYAGDVDRDLLAGRLNVDNADVGEPLSALRRCIYAFQNSMEAAPQNTPGAQLDRRSTPSELVAVMSEYLGLIDNSIFDAGDRVSDEDLDALCQELAKPYIGNTPASGTSYMANSSTVPHSYIGVHLAPDGTFLQDFSMTAPNGRFYFDIASPVGRLALTTQAEGAATLGRTLYAMGASSAANVKGFVSVSADGGSGRRSVAVHIVGH